MSTRIDYLASQSRIRFLRRVTDWVRSVGGELATYESWRQETLEDGESCWFGDFDYLRSLHPEYLAEQRQLFYLPNYCSGSDYSGGSVEASNYRLIVADYGDIVCDMSGDFGSFGVAVRVDRLFDYRDPRCSELRELFEHLADYPVIDEEDMCRLEMELADSDWDCWAKSDFERELRNKFGVDDWEWDESASESDIRQFFEDWREAANCYWENESAIGMHVDIARIVAEIPADLQATPRYGHCKPLSKLASVETIVAIRGTCVNWDAVKEELEAAEWETEDGYEVRRVFLATVFSLAPSGKYYTPWANSNVTEREALIDEAYWVLLEQEASEQGLCIESGEGDSCDIFVVESRKLTR